MSTGAVLKVSEVLATTADESTMLDGGDLDAEDDAVAEVGNDFLELGLDLGY